LLKEIAKRRVVITGAGLVTPLGRNCGETFDKAAQGCSGIDYITAFDTAGLPCRIGGQVDDSWLEGHEGAWQRFPSRGLRLLRTAAREAVGSAGLAEIQRRERIGCAIGFHGDNPSVPDLLLLHRHFDGNALDMGRIAAEGTYPATNFLTRKPDVAVSLMATSLDCGGPALSVTSACAAGSQAIGEAFRMIRNGSADVMVAGGGDSLGRGDDLAEGGVAEVVGGVEDGSADPGIGIGLDRKRHV
jgi:3-oxoacyl-[acyl-carrier-protein] synthase II